MLAAAVKAYDDVAVGVRQVRVSDEVGAPAVQGVSEDPLAERGPLGDARAEEVRRPPDGDPDPARLSSGQQLRGHRGPVRPLTVVAASGRSSVIGRPSAGA